MSYMRLAISFESQANELSQMSMLLEKTKPEFAKVSEMLSLVAIGLSDYCTIRSDDKKEIQKLLRKELKSIETLLERLG